MKGTPRYIEAGERVGRLTVTKRRIPSEREIECRCDCGADAVVKITHWGETQSCGCLKRERAIAYHTTHGMTKSSEFKIWSGMLSRTRNSNDPAFPYYGGRGIRVCDRWLKFENFYTDMGPRPEGLSIDRIDVNGNYEPDNCRWATATEQALNRRKRVVKPIAKCKYGHEFTPENTKIKTDGFRACRTCMRRRTAEWRQKQRSQGGAA